MAKRMTRFAAKTTGRNRRRESRCLNQQPLKAVDEESFTGSRGGSMQGHRRRCPCCNAHQCDSSGGESRLHGDLCTRDRALQALIAANSCQTVVGIVDITVAAPFAICHGRNHWGAGIRSYASCKGDFDLHQCQYCQQQHGQNASRIEELLKHVLDPIKETNYDPSVRHWFNRSAEYASLLAKSNEACARCRGYHGYGLCGNHRTRIKCQSAVEIEGGCGLVLSGIAAAACAMSCRLVVQA